MTCLVCYLAEPTSICDECGAKLLACDECAEDMGENYCAQCDSYEDT